MSQNEKDTYTQDRPEVEILLSYQVAHLTGRVFPAQEHLVRLAMDRTLEILGNFRTNLNARLMECISIMSALFLLSRGLVLLTLGLLVYLIRNTSEHRAWKKLVCNIPYLKLPSPSHHLY